VVLALVTLWGCVPLTHFMTTLTSARSVQSPLPWLCWLWALQSRCLTASKVGFAGQAWRHLSHVLWEEGNKDLLWASFKQEDKLNKSWTWGYWNWSLPKMLFLHMLNWVWDMGAGRPEHHCVFSLLETGCMITLATATASVCPMKLANLLVDLSAIWGRVRSLREIISRLV